MTPHRELCSGCHSVCEIPARTGQVPHRLRTFTRRAAAVAGVITLAFALMSLVAPRARAGESQPGGPAVVDSSIAGTWYPGSAGELRGMIRSLLDRADVKAPEAPPKVLIVPHAGYVYSGPVAACAYKSIEGKKFDRVVIVGPSHVARFSGAGVPDASGIRTPLGVMELDLDFIRRLKAKDASIDTAPASCLKEHSIDIQLPFLQVVAPGSRLVPLIMGSQDPASCRRLADTLAATLAGEGERTLVIASSDLSHYHPYADAVKLDAVFIRGVETLDAPGIGRSLASGECEACGGGPVMTVIMTAEKLGARDVRILRAANSGDATGRKDDPRGVVGYLAAGIWPGERKAEAATTAPIAPASENGLDRESKSRLLELARGTIEASLRGKPAPERPKGGVFDAGRGAFVTLKKHGDLRGCIGRIVADHPLSQVVAEMALAAAFEDPRFSPLRADELKDIEIEISVLTPPRKIDNPEEVRVGVHGLIMRRGGASGLLLPQVPTEQGWDRETFLRQTCRKAGLPENAWKDPKTEIYVFSAEVF